MAVLRIIKLSAIEVRGAADIMQVIYREMSVMGVIVLLDIHTVMCQLRWLQ